jgi:hypothetical protein
VAGWLGQPPLPPSLRWTSDEAKYIGAETYKADIHACAERARGASDSMNARQHQPGRVGETRSSRSCVISKCMTNSCIAMGTALPLSHLLIVCRCLFVLAILGRRVLLDCAPTGSCSGGLLCLKASDSGGIMAAAEMECS